MTCCHPPGASPPLASLGALGSETVMTSEICNLIAVSGDMLDAEVLLHRLALHEHAERVRAVADETMALARDAIHHALAAPDDARQRFDILQLAIELDGVESSLVACAARALAETADAALRAEAA